MNHFSRMGIINQGSGRQLDCSANAPYHDESILDQWQSIEITCVSPWGEDVRIEHIWPTSDIACHSAEIWQDDAQQVRSLCRCGAMVDWQRRGAMVIHDEHRIDPATVVPMRRT